MGADPGASRVTFTLDLEDHRPSPAVPVRYPALTREVLDILPADRSLVGLASLTLGVTAGGTAGNGSASPLEPWLPWWA